MYKHVHVWIWNVVKQNQQQIEYHCFASPLMGLLFCFYRYTTLSIEQASVVPISQHSVQSTKYVKVLISLLKLGQRQCQSSMKAVAMWEQVPTVLVSTCTLYMHMYLNWTIYNFVLYIFSAVCFSTLYLIQVNNKIIGIWILLHVINGLNR